MEVFQKTSEEIYEGGRLMGIFKKLFKSTAREDFSEMSSAKKLEVTRKEMLKDIHKKKIERLWDK